MTFSLVITCILFVGSSLFGMMWTYVTIFPAPIDELYRSLGVKRTGGYRIWVALAVWITTGVLLFG